MMILSCHSLKSGRTDRRRPRNRSIMRTQPVPVHTPLPIMMSANTIAGAGGYTPGIGRPLRIMIVEDEALIAMDLEMTLEDLGAEVVCKASSACEAVRLARQHQPDCATMDINIHGDRDGVSAAIELYQLLGIRSIFVSAYGNPETRERAASANPVDWISKPFSEFELKRALDGFSSSL